MAAKKNKGRKECKGNFPSLICEIEELFLVKRKNI